MCVLSTGITYRYYNMYCLVLVAVTISFDQLIYFVDEDNGTVELMAILSNPSIADITVQIMSSDVTAISKYAHTLLYNALLRAPHHTTGLHAHMLTKTYS